DRGQRVRQRARVVGRIVAAAAALGRLGKHRQIDPEPDRMDRDVLLSLERGKVRFVEELGQIVETLASVRAEMIRILLGVAESASSQVLEGFSVNVDEV